MRARPNFPSGAANALPRRDPMDQTEARDGQARQEKPLRPALQEASGGAYRAGVGVEAGLRALGVGHRARGEDERPAPRGERRDGHPAAAPAVARLRA